MRIFIFIILLLTKGKSETVKMKLLNGKYCKTLMSKKQALLVAHFVDAGKILWAFAKTKLQWMTEIESLFSKTDKLKNTKFK